ncbi:hypothetical protein ABW20_dc0104684 [Dactylellina cionopaga]|nr:hypothetical protein ABW20_dc0104684 [Dactylellina cionopaga]
MRSAKTQAAQRIRSFTNTASATATRPTRKSAARTTTTTTTTIVSKLPTPLKSKNAKSKAKEEEYGEGEEGDDVVDALSDDSELSSAPSDLESAYSDSIKAASSDEDEEYTTSPYFASVSHPTKRRKRGAKTEDDSATEILPVTKPSNLAVSKGKPKSVKATSGIGRVKKGKGQHVEIRYDPPANWREVYDHIKEMRLRIPAAVDTVGCARLAQTNVPPKVKRFQHLIALMMSSQTKDQVTGEAMRRLQTELPGGLTLESILEVAPARLNELIGQVGFHNRKTEYIKKAAVVLRDKFDGDIPETVEDMMSLDGVGPKMSYLLEQCAWNKSSGIGVDVHVHRIANMFKWVPQSNEPETTRMYLQSWLPRDLWQEINWLLVGFGQSVCLPRGRRCDICTLGPKSTGGNGVCKVSIVVKNKGTPRKVKREIKVEEDDGILIKKEEATEESGFQITDPLGIDENMDVTVKKEEIKEETTDDFKEEEIEENIKEEIKEEAKEDFKEKIKEEVVFPTDIPDIEDVVGRPRRNVKRKR